MLPKQTSPPEDIEVAPNAPCKEEIEEELWALELGLGGQSNIFSY